MKYLKTITEERGILTSPYKQEIKKNMRLEKSKSISQIKSMILNHEEKTESQIRAILQVSLFVFILIVS